MTPERWKQVEEVFQAALDFPIERRDAFLDEACGNDAALRQQVEALVESHDRAGSFIEAPAFAGANYTTKPDEPIGVMIGRRVGSYKIVREIGRGGMGAVYLAARDDEMFQKRVAIKLVKRGMDTDFILRRFRHERQILANLDHPNIARLLDGGTTDDNLPYFVMEYVEGQPIHHYCDAAKLSIAERLRLFRRVCAPVAYAHRNQIIHRDIKPGNILVTGEGTPKLLDFGIAKLLNPDLASDTFDPTQTALRLMTPEYASPEQVRGQQVTTATDTYSLGVLLYEILSGHRPYPPLSHMPHELSRVISEENPERPSAVVGHADGILMTSAVKNLGTAANPEVIGRCRGGATLDALRRELAGNLDNIVLKAMCKDPSSRYASVDDFSEDIRRHLDGLPVVAPSCDPLPDKAFDSVAREATTLIDMPPAPGAHRPDVHEDAAHKSDEPHTTSPSYHPQTAEVGAGAVQFKSWNSLVAALAGAAVVAIAALGFYYFKDAQLFGVKMPSALTRLTGNIATDSQPKWSSDGSKLVFTSYRDGKPEIYTMDAAAGDRIARLTHNSADDFTPAWSPDGGKIAFTSKRHGNDEIYLMNADGSNQTNLSNNAANDSRPAWSPDGKRIAFTSDRDDPSDNFEIYVMDADGSNVVRLTDSAGLDSDPNWSPDGKRIAFTSDRDRNFEIYLMNADGSGQKNFSNNVAFDGKPAWSSGEARIAFTSNRGSDPKNFEIWVADEGGRDPQNITNNPAVDDEPAWSPDGSIVAFQSERDGNFEIYVTPARADGAAARQANTGAIVKSLAVLPFKVGGASGEDAYMGVGLADALTARLGQLRQISVRPTSAVRRYLTSTQNAREVGREMGVHYVVDGRIERGGDRVAVSFQLTDVNDGSVLWAEKYDEKFTDITTVQSLISERVTRAMTLELTNDEQRMLAKRYTENSEAYQLYLAGRYHWGKRTAEALKQAIYLFEQAIQKDKDYALAYAGLADCYALLSWYVAPPPPDAFPKAEQAAKRAIELDEGLAEAHASLAFVKLYYGRDWTGAEREFRRAVELNPSYATAHHWFAFNLAAMGRHDEALAEIRVAQELDPRSLIINTAVANILYYARHYDEAIEQCQRTLEMDPGFVPAYMVLRGAYVSAGMIKEAGDVFQKEESYAGNDPGKLARLAHLQAAAGLRDEALKTLDELRKVRRRQPLFAYEIAAAYSLLKETDEAFAWLARAEAERSIGFAFVKVDPDLDNIRPDPRFNALLERIGLVKQ